MDHCIFVYLLFILFFLVDHIMLDVASLSYANLVEEKDPFFLMGVGKIS